MDKTKQIIVGVAIAGTAFAGGQSTATPQVEVQTVYVQNPLRTIEVLQQLDISQSDLERLVPTVAQDEPVAVQYEASSTISQYVIGEAGAGNRPSVNGILSYDEVTALYGKVAVDSGAVTDEERKSAGTVDVYQELRK